MGGAATEVGGETPIEVGGGTGNAPPGGGGGGKYIGVGAAKNGAPPPPPTPELIGEHVVAGILREAELVAATPIPDCGPPAW